MPGCRRMPPMPCRPILVRLAVLTGLLVGLVALADGVAHRELQQAIGSTTMASAVAEAQPADVSDE